MGSHKNFLYFTCLYLVQSLIAMLDAHKLTPRHSNISKNKLYVHY